MDKNKKLRPQDVAEALGISAQAVRIQMQRGLIDIGVAVKNGKGNYSYYISPKKVYELTGVKFNGYEPVPEIHIDEEKLAYNCAMILLKYLGKEVNI